jgi:hypothetical protein
VFSTPSSAMLSLQKCSLACVLITVVAAAGCGSSSSSSSSAAPAGGAAAGGSSSTAAGGSSSTAAGGSSSTAAGGSSSSGSGALSADARSAATGDIPDNQVFLLFSSKAVGFSIKYPEGWTQSGSGHSVTFRNKNNLVRVVIASGPAPTPASVSSELNALKGSDPTLSFRAPQVVTIASGPAVKAVYSTESAPNPVTGKRVKLIVDRYALAHGGRVATVDLGTAVGVDNVDAYRMMIGSFRWL